MSEKKSNVFAARVVSCTFKRSQFIEHINKTIFYHDLELDTGETVECGVIEKNPDKIAAGQMIKYTFKDGDMKTIKLEKQSSGAPSSSKPNNSNSSKGNSENKSAAPKTKPLAPKSSGMRKGEAHYEYIGFAMSYAKDLVIAGKTTDQDVNDLLRVGGKIYNEIGKWLLNGTVKFVEVSKPEPEKPAKKGTSKGVKKE